MKLKRCNRLAYIIILLLIICSKDVIAQQRTFNGSSEQRKKHHYGNRHGNNKPVSSSKILTGETIISGTVIHNGNLVVLNGKLLINDTLIVSGNLILGRGGNITINGNGVLIVQENFFSKDNVEIINNNVFIVRGSFALGYHGRMIINGTGALLVYKDFYSKNKVEIINNGVFVIKENFIGIGSRSVITFGSGSRMYILEKLFKGPKHNFPLLNCSPADFPNNCFYGNYYHLMHDEIFNLYLSGGFRITNHSPVNFCFGDQVTLSVSFQNFHIEWYKDDVLIPGASQNTSITVEEPGAYHAVLSNNKSRFILEKVFVQVHQLPIVNLGSDIENCYGDTVLLDAGSGFVDYLWSTGETSSSLFISDTGKDTYWVEVTDTNGCSNFSDSVSVIIQALPVVTLGSDRESCFGDTITLNAGTEYNSYLWSTGDTTNTINISTTGNDSYWVEVTDANGCSSFSDSVSVIIQALPVATLGSDRESCFGDTITLSAGTESNSYLWSTGDTASTINISATGKDTYWVEVTDANGCSNFSDSVSVTIHALPVVTLGSDRETCFGDTITLNAGTENNSYLWNTGDTTSTISISATGKDTYWVEVTDTNGCSNFSDSVSVTIQALPVVTLGSDRETCFGDTITLNAGTEYNSYLWNTGDTTNTINISATGKDTYWVEVVDTNGCTNVSDTILVTVNDKPFASINGIDTICKGQYIKLLASGGVTYQWNTGDTRSSIKVGPSSDTQYSVIVSNKHSCTDTAFINVHVKTGFDLEITGSTTLCAGDFAELSINEGMDILWNTGHTTSTITINPLTTTEYSVTARNRVYCYDTASFIVEILERPSATIRGNIDLCEGQSTTLTANGGIRYLWNSGDTASSTTVSSNQGLSYWLVAFNDVGCSDTAYANLNLFENPVALIRGNVSVCPGQPASLLALGGSSFIWSNGSTSQSISVIPDSTTNYTVIVFNENNCRDTASHTVKVENKKIASISGPLSHCKGSVSTLRSSGGDHYTWSTGDTTSSIEISPDTTTSYWVDVRDNNGCHDRDTIKVTVSSYDNFACPKELGSVEFLVSENAEFTNINATPDRKKGSCWSTDISENIWFKFFANSTISSVTVKTGNIFGTMKGQQLLITDENGKTLECEEAPENYQGPLTIYTNLSAGNTYYIMVDDHSGTGSFSLSINEYSFNDEFADAIVIHNPTSWVSQPVQYTTLGATGGGERINCTDKRPDHDVWFKFKAVTRSVSIKLSTGNGLGTIQDPLITLYDASREQLSCNSQNGQTGVKLIYKDLEIGKWYYFSVDNSKGKTGSFSLRANNNTNSGNIYYAVADGNWNSDIWSEDPGALTGNGIVPASGDIVYIKNHHVNVTSDVDAYSVYILLNNNTSLNVSQGIKVDLVKRMYLFNE